MKDDNNNKNYLHLRLCFCRHTGQRVVFGDALYCASGAEVDLLSLTPDVWNLAYSAETGSFSVDSRLSTLRA